jgi:chaperonin GroEL
LKTNEKAGDGTTTATILAQAIATEALKAIGEGANPMQLKAEIEEAGKEAISILKGIAKEITHDDEMEQIATISAADPAVGKLVAEALAKVGSDGVITVEEGKTMETTIEHKQGMEIGRGYLSPYFINDQERGEVVIDNAYILLTDRKINYGHELAPFLERFIKTSKNLVVIAGEVVEEGMSTLVLNKIRGVINCVAIQAPAFGMYRIEELNDLAILTKGFPILEDSGRTIESVQVAELGRADKVIVTRDSTIILNGHGDKKAVVKRMKELREQIKLSDTPYDIEVKKERLAKMAGGIAVINVGAATEVELKEKKERVIDAVAATKAAVEEGVVAGGEITLLEVASQLSRDTAGGKIITSALIQPFRRLLENSGLEYKNELAKVTYPMGIDVTDGNEKNLIEAGIIDPVKVTRTALENAISVAVMVMTCDCLIADATPQGEQSL